MAGTKEGAVKTAKTNKERYGANFYAEIGRKGGENGTTGGFASQNVGKDGLTGKERARIAGQKGGVATRKNYNVKAHNGDGMSYEVRD